MDANGRQFSVDEIVAHFRMAVSSPPIASTFPAAAPNNTSDTHIHQRRHSVLKLPSTLGFGLHPLGGEYGKRITFTSSMQAGLLVKEATRARPADAFYQEDGPAVAF
eukprot:576159-Pyramimonas_sp.AAC.1